MSEPIKGFLAMLLAACIWGVAGIFYKALDHVPPLEVLSHRGLWSLVFLLMLLAGQGRLRELGAALASPRKMAVLGVATVLVSLNWFLFIFAVQTGRAIDFSFGFFIFPLFTVLLGAFVLGERLNVLKWACIAVAAVAVALLTWGLGVLPWIALVASSTFALYGLIKKRLEMGPVVSVTVEVIVMMPLVLLWLSGVHMMGWTGITGQAGGYFGTGWHDSLLLAFSGPITVGPLVLMSYALKRLSYSTAGLVGYANPTLQFLVAVIVFAEPFTPWHAVAFPMIWGALAVYTAAAFGDERRGKAARRHAEQPGPKGPGHPGQSCS
jgi:chloramphenicol-sensitive protein RarD